MEAARGRVLEGVEVVDDLGGEVDDGEDVVLGEFLRRRWYGVREVEGLEDVAVAAAGEALPGLLGEDAVGDEGGDGGGAESVEGDAAFVERPPRLDEVVDDDDLPAARVAVLDGDGAWAANG